MFCDHDIFFCVYNNIIIENVFVLRDLSHVKSYYVIIIRCVSMSTERTINL